MYEPPAESTKIVFAFVITGRNVSLCKKVPELQCATCQA